MIIVKSNLKCPIVSLLLVQMSLFYTYLVMKIGVNLVQRFPQKLIRNFVRQVLRQVTSFNQRRIPSLRLLVFIRAISKFELPVHQTALVHVVLLGLCFPPIFFLPLELSLVAVARERPEASLVVLFVSEPNSRSFAYYIILMYISSNSNYNKYKTYTRPAANLVAMGCLRN